MKPTNDNLPLSPEEQAAFEAVSNLKRYVLKAGNNLEKCKEIVGIANKHKISIDVVNGMDGETPLHSAATLLQNELCKLFVENGADPNKKNFNGMTPFHHALLHMRPDEEDKALATCVTLINYGANILATTNEGKTAFDLMRDALILSESRIKRITDNLKLNAVIHAIINEEGLDENFDEELFKKLIKDVDLSWKEPVSGRSFLHMAAFNGNVKAMELLLTHGININAKDNKGQNAFNYALSNPNRSKGQQAVACHVLLHHNIKVDLEDHKGRNLLSLAVIKSQYTLCDDLLKRNADPEKKDHDGKSPINLVKESKDENFRKAALEAFANAQIKKLAAEFLEHLRNNTEEKFYAAHPDILLKGRDENDCTFLHYAAQAGSAKTCQFLILEGLEIDAPNNSNQTPLHYAAIAGNLETYRCLLTNNANTQAIDDDENTPYERALEILHDTTDEEEKERMGKLVAAVEKEETNQKIFRLAKSKKLTPDLLETYIASPSFNINMKDSLGNSLLHNCALYGDIDACKDLIEKGIDISAKNNSNESALEMLKKNLKNPKNNSIVNLLTTTQTEQQELKRKNDEKIKAQKAEAEAAESELILKNRREAIFTAAKDGNPLTLKLLEEFLATSGSDINHKEDGQNLAHIAAATNNAPLLQKVIAKNIKINAHDKDGNSAIHIAAANGNEQVLPLLLNHANIDVDDKNTNGRTALHLAATRGHVEICKSLLTKVDHIDGSVIEDAHAEVKKLLEDAQSARKQSAQVEIFSNVRNGKFAETKKCLRNGATFDLTDKKNNLLSLAIESKSNAKHLTPQAKALEEEKDKIIKLLTAQGEIFEAVKDGSLDSKSLQKLLKEPGVSLDYKDADGLTPLHHATNEEVCKILIEHGANVNIADPAGWTPLHQAILLNRNGVSETLLNEHATNVNAALKKSLITPLHMAAKRGEVEICKLLIGHGAQVEQKDKNNKTALDYANEAATHETDAVKKQKLEEVINLLGKEAAIRLEDIQFVEANSPNTNLQVAKAQQVEQPVKESSL